MNLREYFAWASLVYGTLSKLPVDVAIDYKNNSKIFSLDAAREIISGEDFDVEILFDSIDMGSDKITIFLEVEDGYRQK